LTTDYLVKETGRPPHTKIYNISEDEIAEIQVRGNLTHILTTKDGNTWTLDARVNGEIRPFSMTVSQSIANDARDGTPETTVLTIKDNLFLHRGKFYLLGCAPEGSPLKEFLIGRRYICRLDNFPFSDLTEIDHETRSKLRKFRGAEVGDLEGLGGKEGGHRVRLSDELEDIGLPLSASCYLLYSTP
jgi:hypothetical protein